MPTYFKKIARGAEGLEVEEAHPFMFSKKTDLV